MEKEEARVRKILACEFSASRMSDTKWREAMAALCSICVPLTIKFVDVVEPIYLRFYPQPIRESLSYMESERGPILLISIEWLEIFPLEEVQEGIAMQKKQIDHSSEIENRLRAVNVPYYWEGPNIRIVGHVRNS